MFVEMPPGWPFSVDAPSPMAIAQQPGVEDTIAATKSTDEAARLTAIQQLGTRSSAAAIAALTELLKSDSSLTRAYAARALGTIGAPAKEATER